ncbi:hypothetical protein C5748_04080 [Phyllobacterium phragmitis]|uniref:Uncharacterized protein n=1 Tax=Phyllobacterium phragmitis TaxID=2670329 RepID=A0A2S9IXY1_9HYPH|nr:hypothetical protein [Phyllobacterium phragmitis]PRD45377.1 hypothetical protein C5748_04080 [Phyllobacterium phragmitis]
MLVSDPAGMAKVISGVAMEIAYDPVAAAAKYGFATADSLSEQSLLYLQALANGNYEAAGKYLSVSPSISPSRLRHPLPELPPAQSRRRIRLRRWRRLRGRRRLGIR